MFRGDMLPVDPRCGAFWVSTIVRFFRRLLGAHVVFAAWLFEIVVVHVFGGVLVSRLPTMIYGV